MHALKKAVMHLPLKKKFEKFLNINYFYKKLLVLMYFPTLKNYPQIKNCIYISLTQSVFYIYSV